MAIDMRMVPITAIWHKRGRGVELTVEALIEVLAERFPDAVDWDAMRRANPAVEYSAPTSQLGLYFTWRNDRHEDPLVSSPARPIGEGAPTPVHHFSLSNIWTDQTHTVQRCGHYTNLYGEHHEIASPGSQCSLPRGHE